MTNKPANNSRRKFIRTAALGAGIAGAAGIGYSLKRGIRYPTLGLEPAHLPTQFRFSGGLIELISGDVIQLTAQAGIDMALRAFSPQPSLLLRSNKTRNIKLTLNNVSPDAEIVSSHAEATLRESIDGIDREIQLKVPANQDVSIDWKLPYSNDFTFASIGDSGGDRELAWCIERAHQLGAKFLLHLGDFNYQPGDYDRSIELFKSSPIPCFISIGNHDFHDSGLIYPQFLRQLGPLNHAFTIGKTRFVNIDTAASMFPYSSGKRGHLLNSLSQNNEQVIETVSFTHRPLHDPLEGSTHDIGNEGERDWLIAALNKINSKTLLSGHIHIYDRTTFMGIDNIIAGQGLGHQDILTRSDYSKIVLGEVAKDGKVSFRPEPLSMPMEMHCHPRSDSAKESLLKHSDLPESRALLNNIEQACKPNGKAT